METKTAKILSVQENQKNYNGKNGQVFVHLIKFEGDPDQRAWEYHSLKAQCEKFKIGDTTLFDLDVQSNGNYTNYKIKPRQEAPSFTGGGAVKNKDQGIITALSCLSSACIAVQQSSNSTNQQLITQMAEGFYNWAMAKSTAK